MNSKKLEKRSAFPVGPDRARMAECAVRFVLSLLAAWARVFGDISPFAAALTASSGRGAGCIFSLLGAAAGYLMGPSLMTGLKYIGVSLLAAAVGNLFAGLEPGKKRWFMPTVSALLCVTIGGVFALRQGPDARAVLRIVTDAVICGGCTYFYKLALSPWNGKLNFDYASETGHTVGVLMLLGTLVLTLSDLRLFGVMSLGNAAAAFCVMLFAYKAGAGTGCAVGAAMGIVIDAHGDGGLFFAAAYCLAGLAAGVLSRRRRLLSAVGFILVNAALTAAFYGNAGPLLETMVASVAFAAVPESVMSRFGALVYSGSPAMGAQRSREYLCRRVEQASLAFHDLYETVKSAAGSPESDADVATVFDRAAACTCMTCENTTKCWFRDYETTKKVLSSVTPRLLQNGGLQGEDLPDFFSRECLHYPEFITAINFEIHALLYRRQYRSRLRNNQSAAFNQYADMAAILGDLSRELASVTEGEPLLENRLRKYLLSRGLQTAVAVFRDRGGRLHLELNGGADVLVRDPQWLEKLSALAGVRLCTTAEPDRGDCIRLLEAEPLAACVGISSRKKRTGDLNGDRGAYFKTDEGMLYVILSDGIGSGKAAARYSADAVRILQRFLQAGISAKTAVGMLNDLMLLKNEDDVGTATVDLICIDLFTGRTVLYKYGAAPSYILKNGKVQRICGESQAVGLQTAPESAPDRIELKLTPGTVAVMVSDGVVPEEDGWLCRMLEQSRDPGSLSKQILKAAAEQTGVNDDMTAYVIEISKRQ